MFSWDDFINNFPYTNFSDINVSWFLNKFKQIFDEWEGLYNKMLSWKTATDEYNANWRQEQETAFQNWENTFQTAIDAWKVQTETDINTWEQNTIANLESWKNVFITEYNTLKAEVEQIALDAENAKNSAQASAQSAQASAQSASATAESLSASLTHIETNTNDISDLKESLTGKHVAPVYMSRAFVPEWSITNNTTMQLDLGGTDKSIIFQSYSVSGQTIPTNDIYSAAELSSYTAVDGNYIINGTDTLTNFAIIYNISDKTVRIETATGYHFSNADDVVLFAIYGSSFVTGLLVDYAIRKRFQSDRNRLTALETSSTQHSTDIASLNSNVTNILNREKGIYNSYIYVYGGDYPTWAYKSAGTELYLERGKQIMFQGYAGSSDTAYRISTNSIYIAAESASETTVVDNTIKGTNFAIIYDRSTRAVSIGSATDKTIYTNPDNLVLFSVYGKSFLSGALVDYTMRMESELYRQTIDKANAIETAVNMNFVLPDYWKTYLESRIDGIRALDMSIGNHGDSFIFSTDQHYFTSNQKNNQGRSPAIMNYIRGHSSVFNIMMGGDFHHGMPTREQGIAEIYNAVDRYRELAPKYLIGNHDDNNASGTEPGNITPDELYGILIKPFAETVKDSIHASSTNPNYYYYDNDVQKIRYICLDTGNAITNNDPQLTWLTDRIRDLFTTQEAWTVIIFSHQYFDLSGGNVVISPTGTAIKGAISSIYSDALAAGVTIAAVISGHVHRDNAVFETVADTRGYWAIATDKDAIHGDTVIGTKDEQTMDVFHIDKSAEKIYASRIGYCAEGENPDREFYYGA